MILFENLRDVDVNSKEVLRNQIRIKLDLNKIRIGDNKSIDQKNAKKYITTFLIYEYNTNIKWILYL